MKWPRRRRCVGQFLDNRVRPGGEAGRGPTQWVRVNLVRPEGAAISIGPLCSGLASPGLPRAGVTN